MEINQNKRGMFFTFIAIFFIILFIAIINSKDQFRYTEKSLVISTRLNTINNFILDLEKDIEREIFIGGYRSLLSLQTHIRNRADYLENIDKDFTDIFVNGSINDTDFDLMTQAGQGANFNSWSQRINEEANKLNIQVDFTVNDVSLYHISPWDIIISADLEVNVSDLKELAKWSYNKVYLREISILGFEDPLYVVATDDKVSNVINKTPNLDFVNDITNNTDVLNSHLNNSYYVNSTTGPSFLNRFVGNLTNSEFGIESMVNFEKLNKQEIVARNASVIDYLYFNDNITSDWCMIYNMDNWFRIDKSHASFYEVDILEKKSC